MRYGIEIVRSLLLAISFLTIVPAYGKRVADQREMAQSLYFYPVVGALIGGVLALLAYLADLLQLGIGGDGLIVVAWLILTGGLHGDGLMDTADGVLSGKERSKMLEVMRDSRVGAMGVMAFAAVLLLKFSFLASLPVHIKMWALFIAPIAGRIMMLYAMLGFPYAREGKGLGNSFGVQSKQKKLQLSVMAGMVFVLTIMLASPHFPLYGLFIGAVACLLSVPLIFWIARKLGGHTGDTYGAVCECSEMIFIVVTVLGLAGFYG